MSHIFNSAISQRNIFRRIARRVAGGGEGSAAHKPDLLLGHVNNL